MPEKLSMSETYLKSFARDEISNGISEYYCYPRSKDGLYPELINESQEYLSDKPLTRKDVEKEVFNFIDNNIDDLIPFFISDNVRPNEVIKKLNLTEEDIKHLNNSYYLRYEDGEPKIFEDHEYSNYCVDNYYENINISNIILLKYIKDNIRTDNCKKEDGTYINRYYLKSKRRYLAANDYGMKFWNEEERKMTNGEVDDFSSFFETLNNRIKSIHENIRDVHSEIYNKICSGSQHLIEYENDQQINDIRSKNKLSAYNKLKELLNNPKSKSIIFDAIPSSKLYRQLHFNYYKIAEKYNLFSNNPIEDYEYFSENQDIINNLIRYPTKKEIESVGFSYVYSSFYHKPVVVGCHQFDDDIDYYVNKTKRGVFEILAKQAFDFQDDQVKLFYKKHRCSRGEESPYYYSDKDLYEFVKCFGAEKSNKIFEDDDRRNSDIIFGWKFLDGIKYNFKSIEIEQLKKQIYEVNKLRDSGIWNYFEKKYKDKISNRSNNNNEHDHWILAFNGRFGNKLFNQAKKMYWIAHQFWRNNPSRKEDDRFYQETYNVNWQKFDISNINLPKEKLDECLGKYINIISVLLQLDETNRNKENIELIDNIGTIINAFSKGADPQGLALARDKQKYLLDITKDNPSNLDFIMSDWPNSWRKGLSREEIELYYNNANDYILLDPNGFEKYANWRTKKDDNNQNYLLDKIPETKKDMDFIITMLNQTDEVRGWLLDAANYIGPANLIEYTSKFIALSDEKRICMNLHDALLWTANIKNIESLEAKSILSSIETNEDNTEFIRLLPRYDKDQDALKYLGPILSIRELQKRIIAIESKVDISKFPKKITDILSAPGFNIKALESLYEHHDLENLFLGKFDKMQPFKPYKKLYTSRPLNEIVKDAIGSNKNNIKGTAKNPKKLFNLLKQLIDSKKVTGKRLQVADLFNHIPKNLEESIIDILKTEMNLGPILKAQIHSKSDPEAWVCGNYTDCCMPFGSSINTDYMFNPSTQYFTIKYNNRIIAQSVLIDSIDEKNNTDVIILDNIEIANNYKHLSALLSNIYQVFWSEYTTKPVKVGTGYSDLIPPGGKLENNNYKPKSHISYSDARGDQIYDLIKIEKVEPIDNKITFSNLTERDAELISKMEKEAYPDGMVQGKAHILDIIKKQRELEVPGAASSFVIRKGDEPAGYLLMLPEKSEKYEDEIVAHIYDMAVLPKFRSLTITKKIIEKVLDIAKAYNAAIEAETRESTSYALLTNPRIMKWFESKGFKITDNQKLPKYLNNENFYFLRYEQFDTDINNE